MGENLKLPPLKVLQKTLGRVTERLASELGQPTAVAPHWSPLEWQLARAVAAMHGTSALLAGHLRWEGPTPWQTFLHEQRAHVAARHLRTQQLIEQIDLQARSRGVALVGLKGTALYNLNLYRAGERPMADVDLLVQPRDRDAATDVLHALDFTESAVSWRHRVFTPAHCEVHAAFGEHAQNYLKIELHEQIAEALPLQLSDVTSVVFPREPHPGLNAYPSKAALMIHLLIHAAGAMSLRALRSLHLNDIALLSSQMTALDWHELLQHANQPGGLWWALPPLQLSGRYYPQLVPQAAVDQLSRHCPWILRRVVHTRTLSDVSLSYPRIDAFPGIEWSRSPREALGYIATRVKPSTTLLAMRKAAVQTEVAASRYQWDKLSQGQRLLRWVTSRQTRPQTLHAVRSALAVQQSPTPSQVSHAHS
jgi:hypothetical protein